MKISVALCTYNGEKFLQEQLNSILKQTVNVNEIIVCDDLSTDKTKEVLDSYAKYYPNLFKIYHNEKNLRSNKNFEKAIKSTSGDYIFLSDQDDIWKENKVEETLMIFKKNKNALGVFSNADLIDDNSKIISNKVSLWDSVHFFEKETPKPIDLNKILILRGNFLTGATLCIKKEVKEFCFPFQTTEKNFLHDEWFAYILSKKKALFYTTKKLISYRLHSNQQVGVGDLNSISENALKLSSYYKFILDIEQPKSFKDFKILTRNLFNQYKKYEELSNKYPIFAKDTENKILEAYLDADLKMKKSNPILYFFRKRKDKQKGKRQITK